MLPVSLAFTWMVWRSQRWAILCATLYLVSAVAASAVLPPYCSMPWAEAFVGVACIGLYMLFMYVLVIFTWADVTDVLARDSCFPPSLFRLPVRTAPLALWPMVVGALVAASLWLVTAALILRPWMVRDRHVHVPLWWPAVFAAAMLAWVQALVWSPYGLRWLRVIALLALFPAVVALFGYSLESRVSEAWLVSAYAGLTLVAWGIGYVGVRKGRSGQIPNWEALLGPLRRLAIWWPRRRTPFACPERAQVWFEWRLNGNSLPIVTGLTTPFVLLPLVLGTNDVISTEQTLLSALAIPVFLAGIFGGQGNGNNPGVKGRIGLGPFSATLPMATAGMVGAMLKVAAMSTVAAWALMAAAVPLAVAVTAHLEEVADWWRQGVHDYHPARIVAGIVSIAAWLLVWTWKRQVDRFYYGLTGRSWVANSVAIVFLPAILFLCFLAAWLYRRPDTHETVLAVLPWLLGSLLLCRLLAAGWALRRVLHRGLLRPRTAVRWVVGWLLLASTLFALLACTIPPELVPVGYIAFGVLLAMPMARLAATPLALAWNRHR